ncbi:MBL fold metallo-hydrolase [Flavobacterium sp. WG21]|uniref:MBL fold metallo-hydrolase n=1 Tax=Flavobacterium sp. WG21 TaxID=1229487 RepID=UPI0003451BD7|nr:MBL fold metallo-hydrolase [Flavobacterium sp. WG21]
MEIKFYQAECGDAASIRYLGNDLQYHNIFIDSGYERTFRLSLLEEIEDIKKRGEFIDLWILSHIHDDHIGGIIKYLDLIKSGELEDIVNHWYYNVPRNYTLNTISNKTKTSLSASINQGDVIYEYLKQNNKLLKIDITSELESIFLFGLKLTILSPSTKKLDKLRKKYPLNKTNDLERSELIYISDAKTIRDNDYSIKISDFKVENFTEDKSIENGSSIALLTEFKKNKTIWLADSHPSDIVKTLKKMGYSTENKIECDLVKVAHHGSDGNNSTELYSLIKCNNYVFSTNGENKYNLPEKKSLVRILTNKDRPKDFRYNFYFTYENEILKSIFKVDGINIYKDLNFTTNFLTDSKYLKIPDFNNKG